VSYKTEGAFCFVGEGNGGLDLFCDRSLKVSTVGSDWDHSSEKFQDGRCFVEQLGKPSYQAFEKGMSRGDLGMLPS
jgi:hypothetical protein